ncbi:MAG: hypothetical protein ABEH59_07995 [Halobacteriales archaeon]
MEAGDGAEEECINCNRPAAERYGIYFDSGRTITDVVLCQECVDEFAETDFMAVEAAPILVRSCEDESGE